MKRNSGYISSGEQIADIVSAPGVHETLDVHMKRLDNEWPVNLIINSTNLTFTSGSSVSSMLWGDTVTTTVNGLGMSTLYWTLSVTSGTGDAAYWSSGHSGAFTSTNGTSAVFTNRLKSQRNPRSSFSFVYQIRRGSTSGTILTTTSTVTVSSLVYDITMPNANEGSPYSLTFNFSGLGSGTSDYARSYPNLTDAEWVGTSQFRYLNLRSNPTHAQGTPTSDLQTEGAHNASSYGVRWWNNPDQSYNYIQFTKNNGSSANYAQAITINDTSQTPTISISDTTPDEGQTITITVDAVTPSGTTFTVRLSHSTTDDEDFDQTGSDIGTITMNTFVSGSTYRGTFNHTIRRDFISDGGTEVYYYQIVNTENSVVATSGAVTINDTTSASSITLSGTSINEGSPVTVTLNTVGGVSGQTYTYYYRAILDSSSIASDALTKSDFTDDALSGTFTIDGSTNTGSFTKTFRNDTYDEGSELIHFDLGPSSLGPWQSSPSLTVNDTSTGGGAEPRDPGALGDAANLFSAVSGFNGSTSNATVIGAIENNSTHRNNYTVLGIAYRNDFAEGWSGTTSTGTSIPGGTFSLPRWDSNTDYLELTSGSQPSAVFDGHPYIGMIMLSSTGCLGVSFQVYWQYTSTTTLLKNLWYPEQDRELYTYVYNANGSTVTDTSGNTSTIFSDGMNPGTNGYNSTGRFARDDGCMGFANGTTRLDGNGGPYMSYNASNAYGLENRNGNDNNATYYWGGAIGSASSTNGKVFMFTSYQ